MQDSSEASPEGSQAGCKSRGCVACLKGRGCSGCLAIDALLGKHEGGEERAQLKDTRTGAVFGDVQARNPRSEFSVPLGSSPAKLSKSKSIFLKVKVLSLNTSLQDASAAGFPSM